jgi:hypothetical protein
LLDNQIVTCPERRDVETRFDPENLLPEEKRKNVKPPYF